MQRYDGKFYSDLDSTASPAARKILPLILSYVPVGSAIDFGCGDGSWLSVLTNELCVENIVGLDGPWVKASQLKISLNNFRCVDLDKPIEVDGRYDLAISLEVGEHLPASRASGFVAEIVRSAPVVLFSAAVPGQRGPHHVNEQWQSYWANLFGQHGYKPLDIVRRAFWTDDEVALWYKQNTILYVDTEILLQNSRLAAAANCQQPLDIIHPELFIATQERDTPGFGAWARMAPGAVRKSFRRKLRGLYRAT